VRTDESSSNIVALSDIRNEKQRALSPYGPVRAGLTTLQRTKEEVQLMELLNSLESTVANLNSKSCTVLDTLENAILGARAALYGFIPDTTGTEKDML
jgi:hypothetical protein